MSFTYENQHVNHRDHDYLQNLMPDHQHLKAINMQISTYNTVTSSHQTIIHPSSGVQSLTQGLGVQGREQLREQPIATKYYPENIHFL